MFYPHKFKETKAETVGKWYTRARQALTLVFMGSGFLYGYVSHLAGFLTVCVASALLSILSGREYFIELMQKIRQNSELKERLLFFGDSEYVLKSLAKDCVWRGEEVDPEITKRLDDIERNKTDFKSRVDALLEGLLGPAEAPKPDGKVN